MKLWSSSAAGEGAQHKPDPACISHSVLLSAASAVCLIKACLLHAIAILTTADLPLCLLHPFCTALCKAWLQSLHWGCNLCQRLDIPHLHVSNRAQAYVGAFMWKPKGEEGMSAAESAGSESSSSSAASDFPSTSSYASDQQPASTSSAVPAADADSALSDPSSSEAAGSSPGADTAAGPSGQNSDSDFGGLTSNQQLCEVGTFAQVHTIVPIDPKRAQLLLLGHRRLKRTKQVIPHSCFGGISSTSCENCNIPAWLPLPQECSL